MYELSEKDKGNGADKKLEKSADWNGPIKNRSCTDPIFILGLIIAWIFMTYIGIVASKEGNVYALLRGYGATYQSDANNYACQDGYVWYPINAWTSLDNSGLIGTCRSSCPSETSNAVTDAICLDGVTSPTSTPDFITKINEGKCFVKVASTEYFNRCLFNSDVSIDFPSTGGTSKTIDLGKITSSLNSDVGYLSSFFNDIMQARDWVFGFGFCVALILSFLWCYILQLNYIVDLFIWICFLSISGFGVILGGMMMDTATSWKDQTPQVPQYQQNGAKAIAILCLILSFLWICLLCAVRKQISLSIGLVKVTADAILDMPAVIGYPFVQVLGFVLFLVPWIFYCVLTASMGDFVTIQSISSSAQLVLYSTTPAPPPAADIYTFQYGAKSQWYPWILLGIFYWTVQFIGAIGQITLAIVFSTWYFTRDKKSLGSGEVWDAMKAAFKHSGTAAFGALIIAIIQMIRATIAYFQRQAQKSGKIGQLFQYVLCCLQCCVCCLECCMKFINKNAYIQTAIFGTNFCASAKAAFFLIARNIIRIGAVSLVSELVILVGKLFISLISAGLAYYCMNYIPSVQENISSAFGPTILVFLLAWYTADMFTDIFSMAISVLLQCFVADEEMFEDKSERFAPPTLVEYIDANPMEIEESKKDLEDEANAL